MRAPVAATDADGAPSVTPGRVWIRFDGVSWLVIAAGIDLAVMYAVLSARLSLPHYFPGPGVSLGFPEMLGPDWRRNSVMYVSAVVLAFAFFALALATVWRNRDRVSSRLLFAFPVLFLLVLMWMYPPTAADMFHYHADARTFWMYGDNPLIVPPSAHPYAIGISWGEQPSPYGPFWSLLTAGPALLAGDNFLAGLVLFKLLSGLSYLGCAWLIYRIVARTRPGWESVAVVLFAWNPFVAFRTLGNGHNDMVMMFFLLLALDRVWRKDWLFAFPALALSVLVKFATALVGPMILLYAWHHTSGSVRERLRALAPGIVTAGVVVVLCYAPFWQGRATFDTVLSQANNNRLVITSTPLLLQTRLATALAPDDAADLARTITRWVFLGMYAPLVWQARRDFTRLTTSGVQALFLYLLVASAWFRPWYMLWPVTLAALLPGTWFTPLLVTVALFTSFPDLVEQYRNNTVWLRDYWRATAAPVMVAFWPPLLVWYFGLLRFRSWHFDAPTCVSAAIEPATRPRVEETLTV